MSERKSQQELDFERKHEEDLQRLRGLRLIDDDFMAAVFEERACAEFLLQIILKRDDLTVKEVHGQYSIKNLQGRSVRLDILAVNRENRAYNIEVQRSDRGASEKRARYNSSLLDANLTDAGDDYDALNETYVIFITENDVLKAGLPIYHVDRTVRETGTAFNDQAHIVYVNSQIKDETALGKLMHDFFCTNSKDMVTNPAIVLADEPTGALDSNSSRMLLTMLTELNERLSATILMVTHDAFSASYCNRILFIKDGQVFNELHRGTDTRKEFFTKILEVVSVLGGEQSEHM